MDSFVTDVNDVLEYIKSYRLCERIYSLQKHDSWLEAEIRCCLIDKKGGGKRHISIFVLMSLFGAFSW